MSDECKHGHLARKCLTCDLEQELDQLRADLERVTRELEQERVYSQRWKEAADIASRINHRAARTEAERLLERAARLVKANRWREDYSAFLARRKSKP